MNVSRATVKYAAGTKIIDGRINVVATLRGGGDIKVWADAGDPDLLALRKGQEIEVECRKGNWFLHKPLPEAAPVNVPDKSPVHVPDTGGADVRVFVEVYTALAAEPALSGLSPDVLAQVAVHIMGLRFGVGVRAIDIR